VVPHTQGARVRITQCYLQITPYLPLPRKRSPDGASSERDCGHLITAWLIYLPRKDERLSRPSWLTYSGRFTYISGHPSAAGRAQDRTVKVRRSKNDVLLLYHATNMCVINVSRSILSPPLLRLTSRKPFWLDLQPVDIKSRWRHNWKSAQVVNSYLVCDPTIRQPGFDLPRQQWSLLNRFRTEQGHCGACRRKWWLTDTDLCPCSETQTMSHIVESCPPTKLNGGLSRLHSADEDAVSWLTNYG